MQKLMIAALSFGVLAAGTACSGQNGSGEEKVVVEMTPLAMVGDSARGKKLYVTEGCVICHSVNGVGGRAAPGLDAREHPQEMGAYDFAARMWRGAPIMSQLQQLELGYRIDLTGQELADLTAFALDEDMQKTFTIDDVPVDLRDWFLNEIYMEGDLADRYIGEEFFDFDDVPPQQ